MSKDERTLKMSVELAREVWKTLPMSKQGIQPDLDFREQALANVLLSSFTLEELEGKKGYSWEESYNHHQVWQIYKDTVRRAPSSELYKALFRREIYKTEKQALSALAFAQLSHIVAKYNHDKCFLAGPNCRYVYFEIFIEQHVNSDLKLNYAVAQTNIEKLLVIGLKFADPDDAKQSLITNKQLWEQYWMI